MLPHSILGVIVSILCILGVGMALYHLSKRYTNPQHTLAFYAFLVILAVIHPLGALLSALISVYFILRGNPANRTAGIGFLTVLVIILILGFILSHAVLIIPIRL